MHNITKVDHNLSIFVFTGKVSVEPAAHPKVDDTYADIVDSESEEGKLCQLIIVS